MTGPKLAIVIPYYKLTYFEETLLSLKNQTDQRFNLYIGDDCSPENPKLLIDKYADIITVYKRFDDNLGGKQLTKQWERCIDDFVKDEEWIMLFCDDDILTNNVIEDFYKKIEKPTVNKYNVLKFATKIINETGTDVLKTYVNHEKENSIDFLVKKILNKKRSTLSEHIFRRKVYEKYRFKNFELAFGSDDVAWIEFSEGQDILCVNSSFIYYRKSILSISNNPNNALKKRKIKGIIDSYIYILKHFKNQMNKEQKLIISKKVYNSFKSLYYDEILKQLWMIYFLININGLRNSLEIINTNKNYYKQPE